MSGTMIVRTLHGDIDPADLGRTLVHEHLYSRPPQWALDEDPALELGTPEGIPIELDSLREAGCQAIVEMTTPDYGREVALVRDASRGRGVHIIQATGWQKGIYYPDRVRAAAVSVLAEEMIHDIREGAAGTDARCGVIKVGTSRTDEMTADEIKVFTAAAIAQRETGAAIATHTQAGTLGDRQLDILLDQGGVDPAKVMIGHVDRNLDWDYHLALVDRGVWLGYDHFTKNQYQPDATRREFVHRFFESGMTRLMFSGDLGRNRYQSAYGGSPGMGGLYTRIRELIGDEQILDTCLRANPAVLYAIERS